MAAAAEAADTAAAKEEDADATQEVPETSLVPATPDEGLQVATRIPYKSTYEGGPEHINGVVRVLREDEKMNPLYRPLPPEQDEDWHALVRCGGAGEVADTVEEQKARYSVKNKNSPEIHPGLPENCLAKPDIMITTSMDYLMRTWDAKTYRQLQEFEGHINFVNEAIQYKGDRILSAGDDFTIRMWKIGPPGTPGELLATYWISMYPMKTVTGLPGERAATGGLDKCVRIISLVTGLVLYKITDHRDFGPERSFFQKEGCGCVWCVLHLRDNLMASGADDCTVRLWDIDTGKNLAMKIGHLGYGEDIGEPGIGWKLSERFASVLRMCHLGKDGTQFATCSYDRTVCIWDATDPTDLQVLRRWKAAENGILGIGLVGKDKIATCGACKAVKVWNFETGELIHETPTRGIAGGVCCLDDSKIAIGGGDATLRIHDWTTGKDIANFYAHDLTIHYCAPMVLSHMDEDNWTKEAIMYQNVTHPDNEKDSKYALEQMRKVIFNAINYMDLTDEFP